MIKKAGVGCGGLMLLVALMAMSSDWKSVVTRTPTSAAGNSATSVPAKVTRPTVGDKVAAGNWEYTVTKTDMQTTVTWTRFGNTTDAKGSFFIAYLTLTNIGKQNVGIGMQDFALSDGGGITYAADPTGSSYATFQNLTALSLADEYAPGVPVNTLIMFDINPAATQLKLVLRQSSRTTIDLGR